MLLNLFKKFQNYYVELQVTTLHLGIHAGSYSIVVPVLVKKSYEKGDSCINEQRAFSLRVYVHAVQHTVENILKTDFNNFFFR